MDSISGQLLEDATVRLYRGNEVIGTKKSDTAFAFVNLAKGVYMLFVSYQGYRADSMRFSVNAGSSKNISDSSDLAINVKLVPDVSNLLQVVVQARIAPAIVKNDTIAFNAGSYPSPPNSTVEDLLRKLPGVEIDKDGNVSMQGQKVDKITINGKGFFLNDLRNATQNLPADLVAQVEVFDTKSEKEQITGIKDNSNSNSKTRTINLKLKKMGPQGFFGKVYGGYGGRTANGSTGGSDVNGSMDSYSVGGNATRLVGSQMVFLSGNANNISSQFTGTEHQNGPGAGQQTLNNLQANYRDAWTPKLTATIDAGRNYSNSSVNTTLSRQTALGDSSILQNSVSAEQNKSTGYNAFGLFEYVLDSSTRINLNSSFSEQQTQNATTDTVTIHTLKPAGNYVSSIGKTNNDIGSTGDNISNSLFVSHAFQKKGRQVFLNIAQNSSAQNQPASLFSLIKNFDPSGAVLSNTTINQQSTQKTHNNGYAVMASYTEPVRKNHILDFSYNLSHSNSHSDKESFDFDSLTGKYDVPDSVTTNRFLNYSTLQSLSMGFNKTEGRVQYQIGATAQLTQLNSQNLINRSSLNQQQFNLVPRAFLLWEIRKGHSDSRNVSCTYTEYNQLPSIDQLQPVPDLTNPYLIRLGNPGLKQQLTHLLTARYADFNTGTFHNWQINITSDFSQNQITSNSAVLAGGVQEVEYVNVPGVWHSVFNLVYGFPLNKTKNGNASFSLHGNWGHDISLVNAIENVAQNSGLGGEAGINFHVKDYLFIDGRVNVNQTFSTYSLPGSPPAQTLNENYSLNINWRLPRAITIASYYDLQVTGSQAALPPQSVSLWNASIYKSVFRNSCELRLSAYDLLNSASSFSPSTGVNYTQTQRTNLPGRIFLVSVIYRFRKV